MISLKSKAELELCFSSDENDRNMNNVGDKYISYVKEDYTQSPYVVWDSDVQLLVSSAIRDA